MVKDIRITFSISSKSLRDRGYSEEEILRLKEEMAKFTTDSEYARLAIFEKFERDVCNSQNACSIDAEKIADAVLTKFIENSGLIGGLVVDKKKLNETKEKVVEEFEFGDELDALSDSFVSF